MRVRIDPGEDRPLYVQIMDEVRRAIVVGALGPEDPLPSVRELASELRINPRTVSQAYSELERAGVVFTRRGLGTFVSPEVEQGESERRELAKKVARKALSEAHRNGIGVDELMEGLRLVAEAPDSQRNSATSADPVRETELPVNRGEGD